VVSIIIAKVGIVYSTNFGGERCSLHAHRPYIWLALDGGFGRPRDSWSDIERWKLAMSMDEKCETMKELGAKFNESLETVL